MEGDRKISLKRQSLIPEEIYNLEETGVTKGSLMEQVTYIAHRALCWDWLTQKGSMKSEQVDDTSQFSGGQSLLTPVSLQELFIAPPFTLKGFPIWMVNYMVTLSKALALWRHLLPPATGS